MARGTSINDLIRKMQDAEKKMLDQVWARRNADLPLHSPYEMLTLASIVEKETGKADERPRVAGVFVNRLQKRMRLQSDPTIVYGLVGGRGTLGRGILRSEVDKWTPYNTYAIDGLPPGPIANPGRAALEAVANPSRTQEIYFVADGTGGHVFASSLDEHNRNVPRWRPLAREATDKGQAGDVDRALPAPAAPVTPPPAPRQGQQRSDSGKAAFGDLAALERELPLVPPPTTEPGDIAIALAISKPEMPSLDDLRYYAARTAVAAADAAPLPWDKVANKGRAPISADFGDPGIKVRGVDGDDTLDGPMDENLDTYPVGARTLADQKAQAVRLGLPANGATLPAEQPAPQAAQAAAVGEPRRYRAFDASEGTALDPLRNKTWDLNSPKNVQGVLSYR